MPQRSLPTGPASARRGPRMCPTDADHPRQNPPGTGRLRPPNDGARPPRYSSSLPDSGRTDRPVRRRERRDETPETTAETPPTDETSRTDETATTDDTDQIAELEAQVEALERELERREADHQEIIDRYEHVLAEARPSRRRRRASSPTLRERIVDLLARDGRPLAVRRRADTATVERSRRRGDDSSLRSRLLELLPWR